MSRLPQHPHEKDVPTRILAGRFAVGPELGRGSMGTVFRSRDLHTGVDVAVKQLHPELADDHNVRSRFLRGPKAALTLRSPHVVDYLAVGEDDAGMPYCVMELLEGESLADRLDREKRLPLPVALHVAYQASRGLAALHRDRMIHRDIKPDNLFLLRGQSTYPELKILDLGLVTFHQTAPHFSSGMVAGTIEYMAPEQVVSDPVDERCDLYSLGVVLYRTLTGELPFEGGRTAQLLGHQLHTLPPPPSWLEETLPPEVERMVLALLRKAPDNRYRYAEDLSLALRALMDGDPPYIPPMVSDHDEYSPLSDLGDRAARLLRHSLHD